MYLHSHWEPKRVGGKVISLDVSSKEDSLLIGFKNNHIATCNLAAIVNNEVATVVPDENLEGDPSELRMRMKRVKFNYVYMGFHYGQIDFIEVCAQRPLVATCSNEDSHVRIWNYMDFKSEFSFRAKPDTPDGEEARALKSMAFHPNGYYLALGTTSALRLVYIMENRPYEYRDLNLKNVSILKFSRGGQYLACVYHKSNNQQYRIFIFNAYTLEKIDDIVAHSDVCTDLVWGPKDLSLYSCGEDGKINTWSVLSSKQEDNVTEKGTVFTSITCDRLNRLYAVGEDTTAKEGASRYFVWEKPEGGVLTRTPVNIGSKPTKICLFESTIGHEAIVVGTEGGRIYVFPKVIRDGDYQRLNTHVNAITSIKSDINGRYMFTAGQDGLLNIYQVVSKLHEQVLKENDDGADVAGESYNPRHRCVKREMAEVVLIDRKDIDQYREHVEKHRQDVEDYKAKLEHMAIKQKSVLEEEKRIAQDKLEREKRELTDRYNQLVTEKQSVDANNANLLKANDENHLKAVEDLEALYEKKLAYENDKYINLEHDLLEERLRNEEKLKEIKDENKEIIRQLREEFKSSYEEAKKIYDQTRETTKNLDSEYKKRLAQQEEEHELEIRELNSKHREELTTQLKANSKLNKEKEGISQKLKNVQETKDHHTKVVKEKDDEIGRLSARVKEQELKIEKLRKELEDANETLRKKEKNIYDAKSKINDLQKAKHVLSFRTTEMRKSLEPKEAQIEKLKEELFKLETEFENMFKTTHEQQELLKRKDEQVGKLTSQLKDQIVATKKKDNELNKIKMDLYNCSKMQDNKKLAQEFNKIYQQHVVEDKLRHEKQDLKSMGEMKRHIDYLENQVLQINISMDKVLRNKQKQIEKRTKDNIQLIKDLNTLKMNNKDLITNNNSLTSANANLTKTNIGLQNDVKQLTEQLHRLAKQKGRSTAGGQMVVSDNFGGQGMNAQNSQLEGQGDREIDTVEEIIVNNPQRAKEMMVAYKQELNYLREKLKSVKVPV